MDMSMPAVADRDPVAAKGIDQLLHQGFTKDKSFALLAYSKFRWDGRVADSGGLENHWAGDGPGGSNPSPTAIRQARGRPTLIQQAVPGRVTVR